MTFLAPASRWACGLLLVGEEAGALEHDVDAEILPGELAGSFSARILIDLPPISSVALRRGWRAGSRGRERCRSCRGARASSRPWRSLMATTSRSLHFALVQCADDAATDTTKAVDGNLPGHDDSSGDPHTRELASRRHPCKERFRFSAATAFPRACSLVGGVGPARRRIRLDVHWGLAVIVRMFREAMRSFAQPLRQASAGLKSNRSTGDEDKYALGGEGRSYLLARAGECAGHLRSVIAGRGGRSRSFVSADPLRLHPHAVTDDEASITGPEQRAAEAVAPAGGQCALRPCGRVPNFSRSTCSLAARRGGESRGHALSEWRTTTRG